jgi:hypothetical protein
MPDMRDWGGKDDARRHAVTTIKAKRQPQWHFVIGHASSRASNTIRTSPADADNFLGQNQNEKSQDTAYKKQS